MKISTLPTWTALLAVSVTTTVHSQAVVTPNKITQCKTPGVVAYTFDDGPGPYNDQLLAKLAEKKVKATFFVLGSMSANETQAPSLKNIIDNGHQLASHTYSHTVLDTLSVEAMQQEMSSTADLILKNAGVRPHYMRAPEGACGATCLQTMKDLGYVTVDWNVDTNDWRYIGESDTEIAVEKSMTEINQKIVNGSDPLKDSFIILQHEIHQFSVEFLVDSVVDAVLQKGYRFVSIEECIGEPAYTNGTVPGVPTTTTHVSATITASRTASSTPSRTPVVTLITNPNAASAVQGAMWAMGASIIAGVFML
ncbi:hypothetical protein B0O80DRAFT_410354 [Mortierella sp. GBAus27b]|nr:hypothetical protein B0O80DRAFT_410354 [Mortierella sp. GBAus27b]